MPQRPAVLVVEDSKELREVVCEVLTDEGYDVVAASDGEQAIAHLRAGIPQPGVVVLLDLLMPNMNGLQILDRLQREDRFSSVVVVVMTGLKEPGLPSHIQWVRKPVRRELLVALVHDAAERLLAARRLASVVAD